MSCNYCSVVFNRFRLEKRCPSCGFSFCLKCLDNTIYVKQLNAKMKVCIKCSQYNSSGEVHMIPPPDCYRNKGKKTSEPKLCENQNENKTQPENNKNQNGRGSSNVFKNNEVEDENSPSTSNDPRNKENDDSFLYNGSDSEPSGDDISDDFSEESGDELDSEDLELIARIDYGLKNILLNDKKHVNENRSSEEILRDAIIQLRGGLQDKGGPEAFLKRPPKCTICSAKALVNCKGCESKFCMKCFDMHSDEVCVEYETLEPQVVN